ncbi:autotransporter assembly complex protein TamA [Acinetobacter larvae]|uniref:Translocation and assembly module subunit TamA n=1 Tax=Acinetobacter larvae TaxID=1789224 RepID=A0A1B2M021_9GAMM|nr:outer membrane protein assembly factor [Acinetobacter larvae]AOA58537.1 hypothetical protein BFG52_09365 [Acinetobacter larvae]
MSAIKLFKKTTLNTAMQHLCSSHVIQKGWCCSFMLSLWVSPALYAEQPRSAQPSAVTSASEKASVEHNSQSISTVAPTAQSPAQSAQGAATDRQKTPPNTADAVAAAPADDADLTAEAQAALTSAQQQAQAGVSPEAVDSALLLQQQVQHPEQLQEIFQPIEFEALENMPIMPVDQAMANEIYATAEEAKKQANAFRQGASAQPDQPVADISQQQIQELAQAPIDVEQLVESIQADREILVSAPEKGEIILDPTWQDPETEAEKGNWLQRTLAKIRPKNDNIPVIPKISVAVNGAPSDLSNNIKAKLSTFTVEAYSDYNSAIPQIRDMSKQAAQAVGYYDAEFKFFKLDSNRLLVRVKPGDPVRVAAQNIEFSGDGQNLAQFQVIRFLPDLSEGDILNQGKYENTKSRIVEAANNNGFFDAYWRLHDVKVKLPDDTADINLRYDTGARYTMGEVEFRMSDPSKPLPIDLEVLKTLAPWQEGDDYTSWRVNTLANNLTNTRYFNYTLVNAVKPDPLLKALELPDDLQALVDQQKIEKSAFADKTEQTKAALATADVPVEARQQKVDENQFAGTSNEDMLRQSHSDSIGKKQEEIENDRLKDLAREQRRIPVIVTLNADKLNSLETGLGYGTDTSVRFRGQYRRAIVNHYGHSFDANLELSKIRQAIDGRYNIPYKHPLNDYFSLVGGYEREERDGVGPDMNLVIESGVAGADRIIKNARSDWQLVYGVRYRLDRITQNGVVDSSKIPDAFLVPGAQSEQEALLLGAEATKISSNNRLNPTRGFRQTYKLELGSQSVISDTDMAIVNATWRFIYSLGDNDNHQFVGGSNLGYIFAKDFNQVPYNLRYFAGGDQSIRGFDYKSLSPREYGYKVGGQALAVGSLEYNYQFKDGWRAAVFSDVGNAYDKDFNNKTEYSVGLGLRWRSPIGPIRIDVASGISDPDKPIRVHFFIGSQL